MVNAGSLEGNASWAPDLWGAVRRNIEASKATAQASAATLANATLSEQTSLAAAVIELRVTDANIDLLQRTVAAFKESLRVVSNQGTAGTTPPSDVITARTQLESAQASLIALGVARAQYAHAIAVLAGKNPEDLDIAHSTVIPALPPVPVGVPSTLLQRRPDIAVAERQMAAANAAIGVAEAAYYPTLTLSRPRLAFRSRRWRACCMPQIMSGRWARMRPKICSRAADRLRKSRRRRRPTRRTSPTIAARCSRPCKMSRTILRGCGFSPTGEVLDAAVRDATRGTEIALNEYRAGTVDYTTAAAAQAAQLNIEETALSVQQQRLLDTVIAHRRSGRRLVRGATVRSAASQGAAAG